MSRLVTLILNTVKTKGFEALKICIQILMF